jgi:hypothetical protein
MDRLDEAVDHVRGGPEGRLIVEYGDYECPYGQIDCCDSSPNRHASRHAHATRHAIARSAEPGEEWSWCYVDEISFAVEAR